jgi:hypothetical protein
MVFSTAKECKKFLPLGNSKISLIMRSTFTLLLSILLANSLHAQDTITLVDGKQKIVKIAYETSLYVFYQKIKDGDTTKLSKQKMLEKEDVFKIEYFQKSKLDAQKVVQVYQQDSTEENYLSIDEMYRYIHGRNQAHTNYKSKKYFFVGVIGGAGSSYLGPFWGLIPCSVYTGIAGVWAIKPFFKADNPMDLHDPYFEEGYKQVALNKQAKSSALGALTGLLIGIASLQILFQ